MRLLFALLVAFVASVSAFSDVRVHMEPQVSKYSSSRWTESKASPVDPVQAVFVIKRDKALVEKFQNHVLDLSTPTSKNFRKWMTKQEIIDQMAPSDADVKVVTDYLESFGVKDMRISDFRDKIFVDIPVAVASNMLQTSFSRFRSIEQPDILLLRANKPYSLPEDVSRVVSLVDDIIRLPSVRRSKLVDEVKGNSTVGADPFSACGSKCSGFTTPSVLQQAYSFSPVTKSYGNNGLAVAEFQYQYYDNADLQAFSSACGVTAVVDVAIGGNVERLCNTGCVEALLDIEYAGAIIHPIPLTTIYSTSFSLLNWVNQVISQTVPQWVQSVSYGNDEIQQTSQSYMEEVNTQFSIAAGLGISILFASGDQGVWGRTGVSATFNPDFPAGSPWVTAVGGTNFQTKSVIGAESAWNCGGGGFSNEFAQPSWQSAQVANYFAVAGAANALPAANKYNAAGRGYPDVAALGGQTNAYCVAVKGGSSFGGVAGTSASCPVFGGIVAMLNNVQIQNGQAPLGFLNPWLYANPQCFNDVNDGSQNNCNAGTTGFQALAGWDPATGLGTPNYTCLESVL